MCEPNSEGGLMFQAGLQTYNLVKKHLKTRTDCAA